MRVVNTIERETMSAEWENWLLDEVSNCARIEHVLSAEEPTHDYGPRDDQEEAQAAKDHLESVRQWHTAYCTSCRLEQEALQSSSGARYAVLE